MQNNKSFYKNIFKMKQNQFTQDDIWKYCLTHTSKLSKDINELKFQTENSIPGAHMLSEKIITKLLQFFVFSSKAKICVDVGTFTGMSAIAMAEISTSISVYTIDRNQQSGEKVAKKFISKYKNIEYLKGNAVDILPNLPNNIDIVFIDANKIKTKTYFDILINKISANGVIIVDDSLWRAEVLDPKDKRAKAIDEFNKYVNERNDLETLILPIRHGINIIRKVYISENVAI